MCRVWREYDVAGVGGGEFILQLILHQKVVPFYWRSDTHTHRSLYQRFHILLSMEDAQNGKGIKHLVQVLSKRLSLSEAEWQIGYSKTFLWSELACKLEVLAKLQQLAAARVIEFFWRWDHLLASRQAVDCVDKDSHVSSRPNGSVAVLIHEMPWYLWYCWYVALLQLLSPSSLIRKIKAMSAPQNVLFWRMVHSTVLFNTVFSQTRVIY